MEAGQGGVTCEEINTRCHVPHSPQASVNYLKAAPVEVSFDKVMERFSTFFLQGSTHTCLGSLKRTMWNA
jgi:hypothetical protein